MTGKSKGDDSKTKIKVHDVKAKTKVDHRRANRKDMT